MVHKLSKITFFNRGVLIGAGLLFRSHLGEPQKEGLVEVVKVAFANTNFFEFLFVNSPCLNFASFFFISEIVDRSQLNCASKV